MVHVAGAVGALVACSAAVVEAVAMARRLAPLPRPIALVGETGVGKRMIARFIHANSGRAGPFVTVHGGEVSDTTQPPVTGDERRAITRDVPRLDPESKRPNSRHLLIPDS